MTASPATGELPVVSSGELDDGPLIPSPTPPRAWFVSLVPPKDSLPLDFDPLASGAPDVELTAPSLSLVVPDQRTTADPATEEPADGVEAADSPPGDVSAETPVPVSPDAPPAGVSAETRGVLDRLRGTWAQGLPTPLTVLAVVGVLAPGVVLDVARDGSFGLPSTVLFLLAAATAPLVLRPRSLPVGVVLPPLAFAAMAAAIAWRSGLNASTREIGLDVGTTMALQAPVLFLGTAAALLVAVGRALVRLARR